MYAKKSTSICQVKKTHAGENWFLFLPDGVHPGTVVMYRRLWYSDAQQRLCQQLVIRSQHATAMHRPGVSCQLHWLDVSDRVLLKLAVTVHQCLN